MRILRYLLAMATIASLSVLAKADTIVPGDFAAVVVDPLPAPGEITVVTNTSFPVSLAACQSDQLDGLSPTDFVGCFTGLNNTGTSLTSLTMEFPAITIPGSGLDFASCPTGLTGEHSVFTSISCGFTDATDSEYFLDFSGGNIPTFGQGPDCSSWNNLTLCEEGQPLYDCLRR